MPHSSAARCYARFALGLALDDVPAPVVDKAKQLVLDIIGSCLASSREEFGQAVLRATESLGGLPESTLIGAAARVGASHAVLANGTLAHGLDFDDTREDAIVHTGSVAVTTALAVGEATGASGRAVLEAAIAGVEVMCRVGLVVPGRFHARHYHPTSLTGSFAAAAVAGRLRGLTEDQLVSAFGICGSQAGGIIEYLTDGSWTKRLHPGWAAHAGVVATLLARSGFTGPETVFEGAHGFYQAFAGGHEAARLDELLGTLGRAWELLELTFKPYPCGSIAQPYMDCALRLRERHKIQPEQIAQIRCRTAEGPLPRLWEPLAAKHKPPYEIDPSIDYPRQFIGDVTIRLDDGRLLEARQDRPRGGPDLPMTWEEMEAKFRGNATLAISEARASRVVEGVARLDRLERLAPLMESLTA